MQMMTTGRRGGPRRASSGHQRAAERSRALHLLLGPLIEREKGGRRVPKGMEGSEEGTKGPPSVGKGFYKAATMEQG